jgi:uncharacterized protein
MKEIHELCELLTGTYIAEKWHSLIELYDDAARNSQVFQSTFGVYCPTGCGTCCEHFLPELSEVEASLMAAYILLIKQDNVLIERLQSHDGENSPCPLYTDESMEHCLVYPARGLICRLFGACPSEDKSGLPVYRKCKYNTATDTPASISAQDFSEKSLENSTMQDYGVRLSALGGSNHLLPLPEAVLKAIAQLQFIAAYRVSGSNDDDNGGSGPDIPTPTPIAS